MKKKKEKAIYRNLCCNKKEKLKEYARNYYRKLRAKGILVVLRKLACHIEKYNNFENFILKN